MIRSYVARFCAIAVFSSLATAQGSLSLTTTFADNNGGASGWSNFFDLNISTGIAIDAFDINSSASAGSVGTIDIYMTAPGGSHVGNEQVAGVWTQVASSMPSTAAGRGTPTRCALTGPLTVNPGSYGFAIVYNTHSPAYTNGNGTNQVYSNAEMTLTAGSSLAAVAGNSGTFFNPRVWNGTIYYVPLQGFALATPFGSGCGGDGPEMFYEQFSAGNPFDMSNGGFAIFPAGNEYVSVPSFNAIVPPTGTSLGFTASNQTMAISLPWALPTRTGSTSMVWLCSNGWLSLESTTTTDGTESVGELASGPNRICALWDDLNPSSGGTVHAEVDPGNPSLFHITFTDVLENNTGNANTFQITIEQSGGIEVKYGAVTVSDCLVGYSHGNGAGVTAGVDLSDPTLTITTGTGRPSLGLIGTARPVLGMTATVETRDIPSGSTSGALMLGTLRFMPGIDLSIVGMPQCTLYVRPNLTTVPFNPTGSTFSQSFPMGNDPNFIGQSFYLQSFAVALGLNPLNLIASNGLEWTVENM